MSTLAESGDTAVSGQCDERFAAVRAEFERNFAERDERGASLCVYVDGVPVVDLWGGVADPATARPWERDTTNVVFSCTKGAAALCAHVLVDRGLVDLGAPVASYWPEFARHGKQEIAVSTVLSHQSGVAHVSGEIPAGGALDWDLMIGLVEDSIPSWEPGTRHGYHAMTFGYLVGELVRRVSGRSLGTFFREEIAEPLGLDFWIGMPAEHDARVAPSEMFALTDPRSLPPRMLAALGDPESLLAKGFANTGGWLGNWDNRASYAAELPFGGAITNARGLAGMYAPLACDGASAGVHIVSPEAILRMRTPQAVGERDATLLIRTAFTLGFHKSWPNRDVGPGASVIIGDDAFGHAGMGGQVGFADPTYRMSFGYTMNKHGFGTALNERGQALVDAVYRTLGSPTCEPGFWVRAG